MSLMNSRRRFATRHVRMGLLALVVAVATLALPAGPAQAAAPVTVSLVFNDGLATQYRNAAPLLDSRGLDGTFYVASNWVKSNDAKYMRFYHLDDLYRQGHEIGGMGKDHKNLTTTYDPSPAADVTYKRDQVCGDHQALTGWGYHPVSFAYPGAAENATVQSIVRDCGFTTGRVAGGLSASGPVYAEPVPPGNALRLRAMTSPAGPVSLPSLQNAVLAAGAHGGGWLPVAFNDVCSSADASYATCMNGNKPVDAGVLASFLDWLGTQSAEGVSVRTVRQVMGSEQPPLPPRPFAVSLTFDDGLRSHYGLKDIFARHGVSGSFYVNSGAVDAGEAGTMTWAQIRDLQAAGNDVGGHTRDHVNLLATDTSYEFKTRQVCDDRQRLLDEGLNAVSFAYPFGAMDGTAQPFIRGCGYQSGRKAGTVTSNGPIYSETIPVTENPYAVRILGTNENGPVTLEALQYAVNQAMKYGGSWLPTLFHQICYVGTSVYDTCMAGYRPVSDATIDAFLSWIESQADRNISVRTVADVMGGGSTAPRVSVATPAAGATTPGARPQLAGAASGSGSVSVSVYQGDYTVGTPLATLSAAVAGGQWSAQPSADLPDGRYTVQASQQGGNATGTSLPRRFTVDSTAAASDTAAPEVAVTAPVTGATVTTPTPTVRGTAGTASGDDQSVELRFFAGSDVGGDAVLTEQAAVSSDGSWSLQASALGDGVYTVEASQTDQTGNRGTSAPVTFTVDTTPVDLTAPSAAITSPQDGDTVATSAPTVTGTAGTAPGDEPEVQVSVSPTSPAAGDAGQRLVGTVAGDGTWSVPTAPLADGTYTLQVTQSDAAGNLGTSSAVNVTVASTPDDDQAPTVTLTSPADGAVVSDSELTVTGSAGAATGDAATVDVEVYAGSTTSGNPVRTVSGAAGSGSWSVAVPDLAAGTYTLRATQSDAAGNVGRSPSVTISKITAPSVASVAPNVLGQGATAAPVTVTGTGFGPSSSVVVSGSGVTPVVTARTATSLTLSLAVAADATTGNRTLTVTNADGGTGSCAGCLAIVAGPTITSVTPSTARRSARTTVTVTGTQFRAGQMAVAISGTNVSVGNVRVVNAGTLTAVLNVNPNAALTARSLTVTDQGTRGRAVRSAAVTVVN